MGVNKWNFAKVVTAVLGRVDVNEEHLLLRSLKMVKVLAALAALTAFGTLVAIIITQLIESLLAPLVG
jgi:hypothetical protein